MRRLSGFSSWLIESILQQEATLRFSQKHIDQDANKVPAGFWKWVQDKMAENPRWTPAIDDDDGRRMSRDQVVDLIRTRAANKHYRGGSTEMKPATERRTAEPTPEKAPAPTKSLSKEPWILAQVVNVDGLKPDEHVVMTRGSGGDWILMTRNGATKRIPAAEVRGAVRRVPSEDGGVISSEDPEQLWAQVAPSPVEKSSENLPMKGAVNPHILDQEKLSEEQRDIDHDFEQMMATPRQNHMMINALAGTGKTTILKHLAWKYGKDSQHWLYLVFNAKNRAEANEFSGGFRKFPPWVEIYTTNSFLGHVINDKGNRGKIPATERMLALERGKEGGKKGLEKARVMVDGPVFDRLMTDVYHLPDWKKVEREVPRVLAKLGVPVDRNRKRKNDKTFYEVCESILEYTIDRIRHNFKERVLTLLGLLKSFSVDPRKRDKLQQEVRKVFDKYDAYVNEDGEKEEGYFDTSLEKIKENIDDYKPRFRDLILDALYEILHYDFMGKNYKEEIIGAATWMLEKALPKGTDEKYQRKDERGNPVGRPVDLGDYRDFNDDLWFPTIFADKLNWPHFDVVLADEVQDFNENQKIMLKKLAEAGAKIVAVGDPNQAIYRFRGADNDAFHNLAEMLKDSSHDKQDWKPKSLSLNFRSRPEVLQYANDHTHVKDLKPGKKFKDTDPEPLVTHEKVNYDQSFEMIAKERQAGKLVETAYISRTNQPLVNAALKLLGEGIPFAIIGKDVSGDLVNHIKKLMKGMNDKTSILLFKDALLDHEEKERRNKGSKATQQAYLADLKDTTIALTASIDKFTENGQKDGSVGEFKKWLAQKLGSNSFDWDQSNEAKSEEDLKAYKKKLEEEKPVILTTAHKSKGLEFDRVFILRNDQFPHPRAKHPEELGQESNTKYVAFTRAKHQLHNLERDGQPGYERDNESNPGDDWK